MTRMIGLLTACAFFAACETMPATPDSIAGPAGPSGTLDHHCEGKSDGKITIDYAAASISVTPKIKAKKGTYFEVILNPVNSAPDPEDPNPIDFKKLNVYFFGATSDAAWLNAVYNADGANKKVFEVCANAPGLEAREYKYNVVIPGVGTIDPRIVIKDPT